MERQSNSVLKVAGILMILRGVLGIVIGIIAILGLGFATYMDSESKVGFLVVTSIIVLIGSIISLIAGILGVKNAAIPENAQICMIYGILAIVISIIGSFVGGALSGSFSIIGLLTSVVIPAVFLVGAYQNKRLNDEPYQSYE